MNAPERIQPEPLAVIRASSWPSIFDFDSVKPHGGLKVAVEPVRRAE